MSGRRRQRDENPVTPVLAIAAVLWFVGQPWLAAGLGLVVVAGPVLWEARDTAVVRDLAAAVVIALVLFGGYRFLADRPDMAVPLGAGAVTLAALGLWAGVRARRWLRAHRVWADTAVGWLVWNYLTGGPLSVGPALNPESGRWPVLRSRAVTAGPRLVALVAVGVAGYRLAGSPAGTGWAETLAAGALWPVLAAVAAWLVAKGLVEWRHYRRWVRPLHQALHGVLGWAEDSRPGNYLEVPRDKAKGGDGVFVHVPATWRYDKKNELVEALTKRKLGLDDVTCHWEGKAGHGFLQLRPTQHAPGIALFNATHVRELVEAAKPSAPLIGLAVGDRPVAFDLDTEAPHLLLSAGTGGAKSSTIRTIAAQLMHNGAICWVIDLKRHSQPWLRGLPGVRYIRDAEDIHNAFIELAAEGERRNRAWDDVPLGEAGPQFPRLVVICEELNATFSKLRRYWSTIRTSADPQLSPAVEGFQDLLFMGRAVQIHVLAITQMATAKDLGGPEARENFVVRILGRYTPNAWKMLVPEISYRPAPTTPGRVMVCRAGTATETQVVFFDDLEARDWATSGRRPPVDELEVSQGGRTPVPLGKHPETVSGSPHLTVVEGGTPTDAPTATAEPRDTVGVTLAEASTDRGRGIVAIKYHALRKGPGRDPEFPTPVGTKTVNGGQADVYDAEALAFWARNRPGTKGVSK
jgi:hypothetical protein